MSEVTDCPWDDRPDGVAEKSSSAQEDAENMFRREHPLGAESADQEKVNTPTNLELTKDDLRVLVRHYAAEVAKIRVGQVRCSQGWEGYEYRLFGAMDRLEVFGDALGDEALHIYKEARLSELRKPH